MINHTLAGAQKKDQKDYATVEKKKKTQRVSGNEREIQENNEKKKACRAGVHFSPEDSQEEPDLLQLEIN